MNGLTIIFLILFVIAAVTCVVVAIWHDQMKRDRDNWRNTADMRKRELDALQEKYSKLEKDPWVDLPRGDKGKFAPRSKKGNNNSKNEKK